MLQAAHHVVRMPALRSIAAHAGRYLLVGTIIPTGLFYSAFTLAGLKLALLAGLAWAVGLIIYRLRQGHRVEATLMLGVALALTRFGVAWGTGSAFLYFLQPVISTYLVAITLIGSVLLRKPFTQRAVQDYMPLPDTLTGHDRIRKFFDRVSIVWGIGYLINGTVTLWMLTHMTTARFVIVSKMLGLCLTGSMLLISAVMLWQTMRSARIKFKWGHHSEATAAVTVAPVAGESLPAAA